MKNNLRINKFPLESKKESSNLQNQNFYRIGIKRKNLHIRCTESAYNCIKKKDRIIGTTRKIMNIILQFYPRWNISSGSSATRWRCSDARAPPWYHREPESSRYKVCPKTVCGDLSGPTSLTYSHTLAGYHSSLIGRVSPTTPSNHLAPTNQTTNQTTTNKTCPSTGWERTEFEKYNHDSLHFSPLGIISVHVTKSRSRRRATTRFPRPLCTAYHPAWTILSNAHSTRSWNHEEEGRKKNKKASLYTWKRRQPPRVYATQKAVTESHDARSLASWYKSGRKRRKRREHAPRREEKDEPVPTEVSSKLTGPWLLWASECLARGPGFRYPGQPQQERSSGGGNKKVSLERT